MKDREENVRTQEEYSKMKEELKMVEDKNAELNDKMESLEKKCVDSNNSEDGNETVSQDKTPVRWAEVVDLGEFTKDKGQRKQKNRIGLDKAMTIMKEENRKLRQEIQELRIMIKKIESKWGDGRKRYIPVINKVTEKVV